MSLDYRIASGNIGFEYQPGLLVFQESLDIYEEPITSSHLLKKIRVRVRVEFRVYHIPIISLDPTNTVVGTESSRLIQTRRLLAGAGVGGFCCCWRICC